MPDLLGGVDRDEVRSIGRTAQLTCRRALGRRRLLPEVLIVGGQRCGTTSLFNYLAAHPQVRGPLRKEVHFFSRYWDRGLGWYGAHFPTPPLRGASPVTIDATPYYLFHPRAALRAQIVLPGAKIVALLRDPVERAYSHYLHSVRLGHESLPFADAVAAEPERMARAEAQLAADEQADVLEHRVFSYVARGRYAPQLARWMDRFDDVLVLRSEDFYERTEDEYRRVLDFVGLDAFRPDEFHRYTRRQSDQPSAVPAPLRERLRAEFAEDARQLAGLVPAPFAPW